MIKYNKQNDGVINLASKGILMKKPIILIIAAALICVPGYMLAYGRLLPFSPILFAYQKVSLGKINLYKHAGEPIPEAINKANDFLNDLENSHKLPFDKTIDIILCSSESEQRRINGSDIRLKCYPIYGRIVVSHKVLSESSRNEKNLGIYLKHELSHTLLFQNLPLAKAFHTFPRWLIEGMAVYSSNQFGVDNYYTKQMVAQTIKDGKFFRPEWLNGPFQREPKEAIKFPLQDKAYFFYSEFGMIVDDLITTYGEDNFQRYFHALFTSDSDDRLFQDTYGLPFNQYLVEFQNRAIAKYAAGAIRINIQPHR
jgi:hypothetical protein